MKKTVGFINKQLSKNGSSLICLALFLFCAFRFGSNFLSLTNLTNLIRQISITGVAAIGVNVVIIAGGRDLSVGSTATVAAMAAALASRYGLLPAIVAPLVVGLLFGLLNGYIISCMKVVPLIATLGMQLAARSVALLMNNNNSIAVEEGLRSFLFIGRGSILGIPVPAIIFLALLLMGHVLLNRTKFGRAAYAIGGQEESAAMMGVPVTAMKIKIYAFCGLMAGIAGIILSARMGAGQPAGAANWGMDIMAIVVIGGTRVRGGKGGMLGVVLGTLIIGMVSNMINQFGNVNAYWQTIISGLMLLLAVIMQAISEERSLRKQYMTAT